MNFNPRSPRGERRAVSRAVHRALHISIHAPREGSDRLVWNHWKEFCGISIHAPREGSDGSSVVVRDVSRISIHAPREGSDILLLQLLRFLMISIHAPREGSDHHKGVDNIVHWNFNPRSPRGERHLRISGHLSAQDFNPRSPRGERRNVLLIPVDGKFISIHAPREGSDFPSGLAIYAMLAFQSTLPARGATPG